MARFKRTCVGLCILGILAIAGCGLKEAPGEIGKKEPVVEDGGKYAETVTVEETEVEVAVPANHWANHYYNRGIWVNDGDTYRQFEDGLYRREEGTTEWELLYEVPIHFGRGLAEYKESLYFTCYQESRDVQGNGWDNSVFRFNIKTLDAEEILTFDEMVSTLAIYEDILYVEYRRDGCMQYAGYRLDELGAVVETIDAESKAFLCYDQNKFNQAEQQNMGISSQGRGRNAEDFGKILQETKHEVISLPSCAAMLGGKVVLQQYKDESSASIFLRDVKTEEEKFLFDAENVLLITMEGIYYKTAEKEVLFYYSFLEDTSCEVGTPEMLELISVYSDSCLTYASEAIYVFDVGEEGREPQILQVSLEDWSLKVVAEGESLRESDDMKINQVDEMYFYHGKQSYRLSE